MMRAFTPRLLLASLAALALLAGCKGDDSNLRTTTEHTAAVSPEEAVKGSIGKSCAVDNDCPLYLRCFDATCKTPPALNGDGDPATSAAVSIVTTAGEVQFFVEVVDTRPQRSRGLMHRPRMHDGWGMLFLYPAPEHQQSFWMKNTLIPLDIIFITGDMKVLGVSANAEPKTLSSRQVKGNSRHVLEINAGLAEKYGIKPGDRVHLGRIPESRVNGAEAR